MDIGEREDFSGETSGQDGPGVVGCLFGVPVLMDNADVAVVPVPWEVTVSYGGGAADGPQAVLDASPQLDTYLRGIPAAERPAIAMAPISSELRAQSDQLRKEAASWIAWLEAGNAMNGASAAQLAQVQQINAACEEMNRFVEEAVLTHLESGRKVGLLGGDHSTPLGLIRALARREEAFGILQIDAHADLRVAYEGFTYSHASIMTNALRLPQVTRLVQVGLRDTCDEEEATIAQSGGRIIAYHEEALREAAYTGRTWEEQCREIVSGLPDKVYVSFDIDGLDPSLCPHTGTPVPGGLQFEEAAYLLRSVVRSGREIIGFDLSEVAPGGSDWDGSVGARILYRLATYVGRKHG